MTDIWRENNDHIPRERGRSTFVERSFANGVERIALRHERTQPYTLVVTFDAEHRTKGLGVERPDDGPDITGQLMRDAPWFEVERDAKYFARVGAMLDAASASVVAQRLTEDDQVLTSEPLYPDLDGDALRKRVTKTKAVRPKPGRPRQIDDHFLAILAKEYVEILEGADAEAARQPVKTLAARRSYSGPHVNNLIRRARDLGLLTKTRGRGVGGLPYGELTSKAREVLARAGTVQ